ncbi:MAG: transposase [Planctomycetes bacterium]|nr:transposase [Planctomycetota bacterium]
MGRQKRVALAAIDSTGLESRHCSQYFVRRRSRVPNLWQTTTYRRFPKLGVVCDAGYDSESNHQYCRDDLGVRTVIPAKHGRPGSRPASGYYRRLMQVRFDAAKYGQRWQVETVFSMIKRRLGSATAGRSYWSRRRDMILMAITHNIMIS